MKASPGPRPPPRRPLLPGALVLLFLAACATGRSPGAEGPSASDSVDIGYGSVEDEHSPGSASTVRAEDQGTAPVRSLYEMLSRVPGLRVFERSGGGVSVRVRGSTSFLSSEEPLIVLDGMVLSSIEAISSISPNNVASITVLKDAGETAIYGSRGANGVILIKTKRAPK